MYGVWQVTRPFVCEVWSTNFVIVVRFAKLSWLPRINTGSLSKSIIWHSSQPFVWVFEKVMWARGKKLNTNFWGPLERFALFFKRTASIPNSGSERPVGILEMLLNYWKKRSSVLVKWSCIDLTTWKDWNFRDWNATKISSNFSHEGVSQ